MFNIGGGELMVIMLIALIVLGPQRLPDAARQIGKTMGDLKRLSSGFQSEMKSALDTADDPTRVSDRRNVLAQGVTDLGPADSPAVADAIADVSAQPATPGTRRTTPLKAAAVEPAVRKAAPKTAAMKATPAKKPAAKKAATKPAAPRKAAATKATAVPPAPPRRTKG